jgi:hypothetical protein
MVAARAGGALEIATHNVVGPTVTSPVFKNAEWEGARESLTFMLKITACNMSNYEQEQLLFPSTQITTRVRCWLE